MTLVCLGHRCQYLDVVAVFTTYKLMGRPKHTRYFMEALEMRNTNILEYYLDCNFHWPFFWLFYFYCFCSVEHSGGELVRLELEKMDRYSIFPGQVLIKKVMILVFYLSFGYWNLVKYWNYFLGGWRCWNQSQWPLFSCFKVSGYYSLVALFWFESSSC